MANSFHPLNFKLPSCGPGATDNTNIDLAPRRVNLFRGLLAQAAHEAEEAIEDGDGVWRTAGDIQVNRNKGISAVVYLAVAGKRAAGYGTSADGDD